MSKLGVVNAFARSERNNYQRIDNNNNNNDIEDVEDEVENVEEESLERQ